MTIAQLYEIYLACGCRVTTDSRKIEGGEVFFALKGDNFDGNDYALAALAKGASYAVVDRAELLKEHSASGKENCEVKSSSDAASVELAEKELSYERVPELSNGSELILVENAFEALQQLAIYHRNALSVKVLGLTGTNGKTTTKNLIEAVLARKYKVVATKGNLNNDIGVPLSLLSIRPETELAIIEMGANHPDDIAKLVKVSQPDFGLITNVGKAHLEGFGSFEGVKAAKGELYKWLSEREGSRIFINEDDKELKQMSEGIASHFYGYGLEYQGASILPVSTEEPYLRLKVGKRVVRTQLIGSYNANNVLAALCVGLYFGVSEDDAVEAVEAFVPANKRSQLVRSGSNTLILDAYNANPSSMAAALDGFLTAEFDKKLALLGDMKELGADSLSEHKAVVRRLMASDVNVMLVGEEFEKALAELRIGNDSGIIDFSEPTRRDINLEPTCFKTSAELRDYLASNMPSNSLILIKGSRSTAMEKVLEVI